MKKEKAALKKYLEAIVSALCSFVTEKDAKIFIDKSNTIPELLQNISTKIKVKELSGWNGEDLNEDQLNVLTLISEVYLKKNKSKYKVIEKPSEIINWFINWIQSIFTKSELKLEKNIGVQILQ